MNNIATQLMTVRNHIEQTAATNRVTLVAVTKSRSVMEIQQAIEAGQRVFGENYCQEGVAKIQQLPSDLEWHFIGRIQSNKTRDIAQHFAWVQTVDRFKIAQRLDQHRPAEYPPLNVLIEVNINQETTKAGVQPDEVLSLAKQIQTLPRLKLRGIMAIPQASTNEIQQRKTFQALFQLYKTLQQTNEIDTLSMGMTQDYPMAIEEGATMVRIGTAIFGKRDN